MLNLVTRKRQSSSITIICFAVVGCILMLFALAGCGGAQTSEVSSSESSEVSSAAQSEDFTGTPTTVYELQNTSDFKRTQSLSLKIHKGVTFAEAAALCGEGTWTDNSAGEMKIEGTAGYCTWVDQDGKWMILAGFDGNSPDSLATGEVFVRPVDEHIYDGLSY